MPKSRPPNAIDPDSIRPPAAFADQEAPNGPHFRPAAGWLLLLHAVFILVLQSLRQQGSILNRIFSENTLEAFVWSGVLSQLLLCLLPTALILMIYRLPTAQILGGQAKAGSLILAFTVGIPAAVVFQGLNNLLIYAWVRSGFRLPQPTTAMGFLTDGLYHQPLQLLLIIILVAVLLPAIIEELMFRGVIQAALHSTGSITGAVLLQAIAFALFHADPLFILPPFLAGLLLGYIRLQSKSLFPAILAHLSLNLSMLLLTPLLPQLTAQYIAGSISQAHSLLYASLIAACIAAVAFVPLLILLGQQQKRPSRKRVRKRPSVLDWRLGLALAFLFIGLFWQYGT